VSTVAKHEQVLIELEIMVLHCTCSYMRAAKSPALANTPNQNSEFNEVPTDCSVWTCIIRAVQSPEEGSENLASVFSLWKLAWICFGMKQTGIASIALGGWWPRPARYLFE
jgi:hypothetical protein